MKESNKDKGKEALDKKEQLECHTEVGQDQYLTTNQGVRVNDDQNTLKAGERGPSLLEDFIMREKITHFDHERIPERVVHARGSGAHGYFQVYESMEKYTKAGFLQDPSVKTPVFARFSTVAGSRGSTDLARDVRGFAVKFYTSEGIFDLVGNNIPVFFIQDAIKFPDLIHAVKPEPNNEMPQAASAHDTFWDFISTTPESTHMIMWIMSDRAIPRSLRMMEGFGVHTFRLINKAGESHFVKFHWKPLLGVHSVLWDEAQKISGQDPDFHRRDLWDSIDSGDFAEFEFGMQIVKEEDEHNFDFDLLDPTKLIPEELVPVKRIGKMVLNRNPDNFFAETEQVAFHPGHVVPGIDFTNDPLLQGRLFSYTDTQLIRLGGPNFHEIPINRPLAPLHNNQRDGYMRQMINRGQTSYHPNRLGGGFPMQAKEKDGGFVSYREKIDAQKVRARSESFMDHFSQATLFWNSQSDVEKWHMIKALRFELGKVDAVAVRERMLALLDRVDGTFAKRVAEGLGLEVPKKFDDPLNMAVPADVDLKDYQPTKSKPSMESSEALSMADTVKDTIKTRKIAILAADGVSDKALSGMKETLMEAGAKPMIVSSRVGTLKTSGGKEMEIDFSLLTAGSVLFDAVYVPDGDKSVDMLKQESKALHFVQEAYMHCKTIGATGTGVELLKASSSGSDRLSGAQSEKEMNEWGVICDKDVQSMAEKFIKAVAMHRHWRREMENDQPPA